MKLKDWLTEQEMSASKFADWAGFEAETVRTWARGTAVPRYDAGRTIYALTCGAVEPNDFYDIAGADKFRPGHVATE